MSRRRIPHALATLLGAVVVLCTPAAANAECVNEAVRGQQKVGSYLSECRGYELVSPPNKDDEEVSVPLYNSGYEIQYQAATEVAGSAFQYNGGPPEAKSAAEFVSALGWGAAAGPNGEVTESWASFPTGANDHWGSLQREPPNAAGNFAYYSPNLQCGVQKSVLPQPTPGNEDVPLLAPGETPEEELENIYVVGFPARGSSAPNHYTLVTTTKPFNGTGLDGEGNVYFIDGVTQDCSTVMFDEESAERSSGGYELPVAPGSSEFAPHGSIFKWTAQGGGPVLQSVLPDGTPATELVKFRAGSGLGSHSDLGALSSDGSKVFFTASTDGSENPLRPKEVFMHEEGKPTVSISKSETATNTAGAVFSAASTDGSRVFFRANYGLTATTSTGANARPTCSFTQTGFTPGTGCDLYEYKGGKLTDLSADVESVTGDKAGANVHAVIGISSDGSYVYFAAGGRLVAGQGKSGAENEAAATSNVYAYHEGHLSYVTNLPEYEVGGLIGTHTNPQESINTLDAVSQAGNYEQARVSENGLYLLLVSRAKLSSFNNADRNKPTVLDYEDYEFNYASGELACVSCVQQPVEAVPGGSPFSPAGGFLETKDSAVTRSLLNDGTVFFDFYTPLLTTVGEGEAVTEMVHVWSWHPDGVNGCTTTAGCVGLIDGGTDKYPSYFQGASNDGSNIYFTTPQKLVDQDPDGLRDLYDARVDGGQVFTEEQRPCNEAEGKECQGKEAGQIGTGPSASEAKGEGNPPLPAPAPKKAVEAFIEKAVAVSKHSHKGNTITLTVAAPGKGKVSISGNGVSSAGKSVSKSGSYTIKLTLGKKAKTAVKHHKKLKVKLHVAFTPSNGKASAVAVTITV